MIIDDIKINQALADVGIQISNIYDLVNTKQSYSAAIPVLIELLNETFKGPRAYEGIVRALTVREARGKANKALLKTYDKTPKTEVGLRWAIGNAFVTIITPDDTDAILRIVKDATNGTSRQMFVFALGKVKSAEVEDVLISLLDDGEVSLHAISALRKLGAVKALPEIEKLRLSRNPAVKKAAISFIRKFGK